MPKKTSGNFDELFDVDNQRRRQKIFQGEGLTKKDQKLAKNTQK